MSTRYVSRDDVSIWTESTGKDDSTPVLLIAGANAGSRMWPDELVGGLAEQGYLVIRYDHRDTGRSTTRPFEDHPYTVADLAADAVAVLDGHGIARAHVVGFSLGNTIAQLLALDWPHRLLSATMMCGAALDVDFARNFERALTGGDAGGDLPTPDPDVVRQLMQRGLATTPAEEVRARVEEARTLANGGRFDADEIAQREAAAIAHAGTHVPPHQHALATPVPTTRGAELGRARTRALVVQAARDPLNPPPHGQHLAQLIPGARVVEFADVGHNLPGALLDDIERTLVEHFKGSGAAPALAAELIDLAAEQERTLAAFTARAIEDTAFGERVRDRLGWHPTDEPGELWARFARTPTPPWLSTWDTADDEANALAAAVARGAVTLARVVDEHGWPGRTLVGEDGADAAWMLAMHADADPALQERCVDLLERAIPSGEVDPRHYATLADRIAANGKGVQQFGTLALPGPDGPRPLLEIVDPGALDQRRSALGLPRLDDDLVDGPGQLPYRHLRRTDRFRWPRRQP